MAAQSELPSQIKQLLVHPGLSCSTGGPYTRFHQRLLRKQVQSVVDAYENGRGLLRYAAKEQLHTARQKLTEDDVGMIDRALACLFVVGDIGDIPEVEALLSHRAESIRKAARTCLFEIRQSSA
ncbi:MAG TPA: hypothetical protein VIL86_04705 [Tepidisphaeraceae bacterium]|jgi:hypothetical protein